MMTGEAEDDLDAFFDEVSEIEAKAQKEEEETSEKPTEEPAKKKPKLVGVVVASSKERVIKSAVKNETEHNSHPHPVADGGLSQPADAFRGAQGPASLHGPSLPTMPLTLQSNTQQKVQTKKQTKEFKLFAGNLPKEVTDQNLYEHFTQYPSLLRAQVAVSKRNQSLGYGFVYFSDPLECARAIREKDQTWLKSRPIRIKKATTASSHPGKR